MPARLVCRTMLVSLFVFFAACGGEAMDDLPPRSNHGDAPTDPSVDPGEAPVGLTAGSTRPNHGPSLAEPGVPSAPASGPEAPTASASPAGSDAPPNSGGAPAAPGVATKSPGFAAVAGFGANPGGLKMYKYVPKIAAAKAALVVALHGCSQNAQAYRAAGWDQLADKWGFYVAYAEASGMGCFLWYEAMHTKRGSGQALSIKQMVDRMLADHDIDPGRVYVTGLSAGGAMTATMLAAYPDVFDGGAVIAGIPHGCASSFASVSGCMQGSTSAPAAAVRQAGPSGYSGPMPRVSIWHGGADYMVSPQNLDHLVDQWTSAHGIDAKADTTDVVDGATRETYHGAAGSPLVETWSIPGMSHGTPVDPGAGCGQAGAFFAAVGICSSERIGRFFGLDELAPSGATPPPSPPSSPPSGQPPAPPAPPASGSCAEFEDHNFNHVTAGRAERCGLGGSRACAKGSGDDLGIWSVWPQVWVREVSSGHFEAGRCR